MAGLFLTACPELRETASSVHMRLIIKGIFLPVGGGICSILIETVLAGGFLSILADVGYFFIFSES